MYLKSRSKSCDLHRLYKMAALCRGVRAPALKLLSKQVNYILFA